MAKKVKNSRVFELDMTGVDAKILVEEGDYTVRVEEVEQKEGESSGKPYLKFTLKIKEGPQKGQTLYHQCSLQPQALFNLKGTLLALGVPVPNKLFKLNLDDLEGREMGVTVEHETYEGKKRARVTEVFSSEGASVDTDDDDEEEVDFDEMDLEELLAYAEENEVDLSELSKKDQKKVKKVREAIKAAVEAEDDDDDDEDL